MILDLLPQVRRIRPEDIEALRNAAAADQHRVVAPTHVIEKEGKIVGYLSVGAVLLLNCWVDSKAVKARESAYLLNMAENIAAAQGAVAIALPCAEDSPFMPFMEKLGYTGLGWASYNIKAMKGTP